MTTLRTTTSDDLAAALDGLAAAAEQARDDARTRAVLAVVVQRLEDAAGTELGETDHDALVVLQRRFGRAHAQLAAHGAAHVDADLLHGLAKALQPEPAGEPAAVLRPASAAVLAGC
jgi:predicted transcriptional regulator